MSKNSNDYKLCQPSSGYYFSSGLVVSETIYTSTSHGALYNAASRVIVDGGRKIIQTAALGGMLAQNFTIPAYAGDSSGVVVSATTSTVSAGETWSSTNLFSAILNVYGTTIETNVLSIGSEKILYGGIASGTTVWNGGCQAVSNGGTANSTTINSGGMQSVFGGGSALGTVQLSGGNVNVDVYGGDTSTVVSGTNESGTFRLSNGVASGFILYSGGVQIVDEGGVAINTIIVSSGTLTISSGASANDVTVLDSGVISVMLGGQISGLTQQEYGLINFTVAGDDEATYISGTNQNISGMLLESGVASGFVINSGAIVNIFNGGSAVETVINAIGRLNVRNGTAENTIVNGRMNVSDGGLALSTTINADGLQVISEGGVASATEIYGMQVVQMDGSAVNYTVKSGGSQLLDGSRAYSKDFTVESGGYVRGVHQVSNGKISFNVIGGDETTYISGTNQNSSGMLLEGGVASGFVINSGVNVDVNSNGSAVATIVNAEGRLYVSNGTAENTIVNSNGRMYVESAGSAISTMILSGGIQNIDGVASNTVIQSGATQNVSSAGSAISATIQSYGIQNVNGVASNTDIQSNGMQVVRSGAIATATTIGDGGYMTIDSGGQATGIVQSAGAKIDVRVIGGDNATIVSGTNENGEFRLQSGIASNFVINNGIQSVFGSGAMAIGTTLNSTRQSLYAGTQAIGTIANYGAGQVVNPNALATSTTLINSAWQDIYESAIASDTLVGNSAMQLVHSGALATSTTIQDAGLQYVFGGGNASNTVVGNSGTQDIIGGYAEDTTIQNGGLQKVSSGSLASNTEIQSGGSMHVSSGGSATAFTVRDGGRAEMDSTAESVGDFTVESGGYVSGAVQSSGASITFNAIGGDENTYIAGTNELGSGMLLESGVASGFVLNNGANIDVNSNGSTVATIINSSGRMNVINGTAENTTINENGSMFVQNAGHALSGVINNAGQQTVFGLAQYISVNSGGHQTISAGGADFGVVSEDGIQIVVGGSASQTQVYGEQRLSAGTDHNAVIHSNAVQNITGGTAYRTTISGNQNISSGGAAESATIQSGGSQTVRDGGIATSTTIEDGGTMAISQGGQATGIVQSAGAKIDVMIIGGDSTTLVSGTNENGEFRLQSGIASNFVVNSGASQVVQSGASAIETTVNGGAYQAVYAGGSAIGATVNNGLQYLNVGASATGTILNEGADQYIYENAVANETILESGATQHITSDGLAISTTIRNGGLQNVYDGGIASSTDIQSGGTQHVYSGGSTLMYTISSGGIQIIDEGGYASGYIVEGDQVISSGGNINNVDVFSGGTLDIQTGGTVTNLNITEGGTVNVSGDVSIAEDTILNGGNVVISRMDENTPSVFTVDNLSGNGGTFDMTVPLDNPAETDKINVNSSHDGDAVIRISYTGNEDPVGEGIQLVHYADPANANGTFFLDSGSVLDTGWYEHSLARGGFAPGTEKDYYLRATSNLTPIAKAVSDTPQIAEAAVTVALNSLQKRLGDLRNMQNGDATQGVWARGYYKSMTVKGENETDMDVSGLEAGYDWRIGGSPVNYSGEGFYLGLMAGAADISGIKNETGKTTGKGSSFLGGLYGTYIAENGWFTDFTARAGNNELDITVKGAETLKMKPERMFWSVSAEAGKQFSLGSKGRFTLEPKAEVRYTNVGSDTVDVENSGGKKAKFDGSDTLNAIGTINATYRMARANGLEIAPYAEVAWTQTITGEESVTYNNHKEKTDMTGGVFEGRLGLNMQLSKNVYWHIAGSYETGKKLESYGADAGIRFMFGGKGKSEAKPVAQPKIAIDQAKPFTLGSTTFKTGATNLTDNAKENLDGLVEYLNANPKTRITVAGHTDSTGSVERNNVISEQRAIAVKDYLTEQGISADRIKTVGYGSTKPAATNATAEGREKNRRIEITFDK